MRILEANDIVKTQGGKKVLSGVSLTLEQGDRLAIAGATGSGKTSLLKIMGGLMQADQGQVYFEGARVPGPDEKLLPGHPGIAYLSQHFELRNHFYVHEILEYANLLDLSAARNIYRICRIDHLLERKTDQLSGGEKQRIALARLLVGRPRLLLMDEPFSNLDMIHKTLLKEAIQDIGHEFGLTMILVTHEPTDSLSWAREMLILREGKIEQLGKPETIYNQPVSEYVAGLMGTYNWVTGAQARSLRIGDTVSSAFFRPSDVVLDALEGVPAVIEGMDFMGVHYELRLRVGDFKIIASSLVGDWTLGQTINISVKRHQPL